MDADRTKTAAVDARSRMDCHLLEVFQPLLEEKLIPSEIIVHMPSLKGESCCP